MPERMDAAGGHELLIHSFVRVTMPGSLNANSQIEGDVSITLGTFVVHVCIPKSPAPIEGLNAVSHNILAIFASTNSLNEAC